MAQASQQCLEVPLALLGDASSLPAIEVPALGEPLFEFVPLPEGSARAGRSQAPSASAASSRCLVWQLEGGAAAQQHLLLQEVAVNEERRGGAARLAFAAPLLPAVSCVEGGAGSAGTTRLAVVTADGALHTLTHAASSDAPSLARQLAAPEAVTSVPLAPLFQRAGAPTAVVEVAGWVCVGTADGNIVCLPSGAADAAAAVTLTPTSGLSKARAVGRRLAAAPACCGACVAAAGLLVMLESCAQHCCGKPMHWRQPPAQLLPAVATLLSLPASCRLPGGGSPCRPHPHRCRRSPLPPSRCWVASSGGRAARRCASWQSCATWTAGCWRWCTRAARCASGMSPPAGAPLVCGPAGSHGASRS